MINYATDEDIALRASADFAILCPKDQRLAWGNDGVIAATDRWTLTSASVNFQANGLMPGQIVQLLQPVAIFRPPGEMFVVLSVGQNSVTLRRKGQSPGLGQPAGPASGVSSIEFLVTTFAPQIARASYELNRRYGIDDLIAGRRPCDLFDPQEVLEATVLSVLCRQYTDMSRGPDEKADTFATKARIFKQELDDLLARTVIHWISSIGAPASSQATTRLSARISR